VTVFDRVLVGVDGTEWGFEALRQALVLAPEGSEIHAVTACDTGAAVRTGFEAAHWTAILEEEAAAARDAAAAILGDRPRSEVRVVGGDPLRVLRRARERIGATVVALGGRESSRFLGIMLGDTATELLHDGACSVLVARPRQGAAWQPRAVVVGVDGSASSLAALDAADELASRLRAAVEVVSATGDGAARPDPAWTGRVDSWAAAHPVAVLVERSRRADLVVVGSHGRRGVRALGSVSERVAHRAHCSVLVVRGEADARDR